MIQRIADDPPEVWFGDGSSRGYGTSRWRSFRHNAARDAASATRRYVNVNSATPTAPYTNWSTAATVIQDAIDIALPDDEIVVTNGVYEIGHRDVPITIPFASAILKNRVAVTKPLTIRSVNGPEVTIIRGYQVPGTTNGSGALRCVYLTGGASLVGFTLTNGATGAEGVGYSISGAGAWCESISVLVSNCVLVGNSAKTGGGSYSGTLNNCTLIGNWAGDGGGAYGGVLNNCTLIGNRAAGDYGGGAVAAALNNCTLNGNSCAWRGGGAAGSTLNNCVVTANSADEGGGTWGAVLNNCTVTGNSAQSRAGGAFEYKLADEGSLVTPINNCILYYNNAPMEPNYGGAGISINYSCTTPIPTHGIGNFTNTPLFVDPTAGNFRLESNSPCINAGLNAFAPIGPDLDGNPRIAGGTVDIGAYEFQKPTSSLSYAWLEQFGLPTDGSADSADTDGDGCNNWQEWRAGTEPNNSLSVLRLLSPMLSSDGLVLRWQSVTDRTYRLERNTNLTQGSFEAIASNIVGQVGVTAYMDTNAETNRPLFYRLRVEE